MKENIKERGLYIRKNRENKNIIKGDMREKNNYKRRNIRKNNYKRGNARKNKRRRSVFTRTLSLTVNYKCNTLS